MDSELRYLGIISTKVESKWKHKAENYGYSDYYRLFSQGLDTALRKKYLPNLDLLESELKMANDMEDEWKVFDIQGQIFKHILKFKNKKYDFVFVMGEIVDQLINNSMEELVEDFLEIFLTENNEENTFETSTSTVISTPSVFIESPAINPYHINNQAVAAIRSVIRDAMDKSKEEVAQEVDVFVEKMGGKFTIDDICDHFDIEDKSEAVDLREIIGLPIAYKKDKKTYHSTLERYLLDQIDEKSAITVPDITADVSKSNNVNESEVRDVLSTLVEKGKLICTDDKYSRA